MNVYLTPYIQLRRKKERKRERNREKGQEEEMEKIKLESDKVRTMAFKFIFTPLSTTVSLSY